MGTEDANQTEVESADHKSASEGPESPTKIPLSPTMQNHDIGGQNLADLAMEMTEGESGAILSGQKDLKNPLNQWERDAARKTADS